MKWLKNGRRIIALALALTMVFRFSLVSVASEEPGGATVDVGAGDYTLDENNNWVFDARTEVNYGTIVVPTDYTLLIAGTAVTAGTITLSEGGSLSIFDTGEEEEPPVPGVLNCANIQAADGAIMMLGSKSNCPAGITLYEDIDGQLTEITDEEWMWSEFRYTEDGNGSGNWVRMASGPADYFGEGDGSWNFDVSGEEYVIQQDTFVIIEGANVTFGTLTMESNSWLEVWNSQDMAHVGTFSYGTLNAAQGARLIFGSKDNIPESLKPELKEEFERQDGSKELMGVNFEELNGTVEFSYDNGNWILQNQPGGEPEETLNWERLRMELAEGLFAFGDWTQDTILNEDDLEYGMACMLYDGFKVREGRYQREGEALGLAEETGSEEEREQIREANIQKLITDYLSVESATEPDLTVKDLDGTTKTLKNYKVTLDVSGVENLSTVAPMTATVYLIDQCMTGTTDTKTQVIIKVGAEYFLRDAAGETAITDLGASLGSTNTRAVVIVVDEMPDKDDIQVFGNNASLNEEVLSDPSAAHYHVVNFHGGNDREWEMGGKLAVYDKAFSGTVVQGKGEENMPLAWDVNTAYDIRETGENADQPMETDLFFGYSKAVIKPLTNNQLAELSVTGLESVSVEGNIPENAVTVTKTQENEFEVEFLSDYYDTVTLKMVYNCTGSTTRTAYLTINRVGIVVQNGMTPGDSPNELRIMHGHDSGDVITREQAGGDFGYAIYGTYYFPSGAGALTASDTSLYVTMTYKDGSTEQKVIPATFFTRAENGNCAMADFVIYTGTANDSPVKVESIAVENADANGRFNGAKLGAGKGVAKDIVTERY